MNRSRRLFVANTAGSAVALALGGCGGDDYTTPAPAPAPAPTPAPPPPATLSCGATAISANHGHVLLIPAADVDSTISITYNIVGAAGHDHSVTLTAAQLAQIKAKSAVTVMSTSGFDLFFPLHTHSVTVNCA